MAAGVPVALHQQVLERLRRALAQLGDAPPGLRAEAQAVVDAYEGLIAAGRLAGGLDSAVLFALADAARGPLPGSGEAAFVQALYAARTILPEGLGEPLLTYVLERRSVSRGPGDPGAHPEAPADVPVHTGHAYTVRDAGPEPGPQAAEPARFFNVALGAPGEAADLPATQPLIVGRAYVLRVQIAEAAGGLGAADAFVDAAVAALWQGGEPLPITVAVGAEGLRVEGAGQQVLLLPRRGASAVAAFSLRAELPLGTALPLAARVWVQLYHRGYFLQSKEVRALIYAEEVGAVPGALSARRLDATVARLSEAELRRLPSRLLTLSLLRTAEDTVGMTVLVQGAGAEAGGAPGYFDTRRPKEELLAAASGVRGVLRGMVAGDTDELGEKLPGYAQLPAKDYGKPAPDALLKTWLPMLAAAGHALYRLLFKDAEAGVDPPAGTVIQINQHAALLGDVTVPWALLYPRRPPSSLSDAEICTAYREPARRDCTGCPNAGNPRAVCPLGFWGFRYGLEQLPGWAGEAAGEGGGGARAIPPLVRVIKNQRPVRIHLVVFPQFPEWPAHRGALEAVGQAHVAIELASTGKVAEVETLWDARAHELDLIDFYVHGGSDKVAGLPMLLLGARERVQPHLLEKYEEKPWARGPLVLLNGCATADYRSQSYASLVAGFRRAGASGVVATECLIFESLATEYTAELLRRLLAGQALGPAMLDTRLHFLKVRGSPLGLVYACYAASEVALAQPAATPP